LTITRFLKHCLLFVTTVTSISVLTACQSVKIDSIPGDKMGMVLMHGKGGETKQMSSMGHQLKAAGVLVEMPLMPWSEFRIYDKGYEESMEEIDIYVERLKMAGAKRIVIAGHSLGANAALGYAARREDLAGVILLAYGHAPGIPGFGKRLASSVDRAQAMIKAGKGESTSTFTDANQTQSSSVSGTANDILSWFDPNGPATISYNAPKVKQDTPVLCIYGSGERWPKCSNINWKLPINTKNRIVKVSANHNNTPSRSIEQVGIWLGELD